MNNERPFINFSTLACLRFGITNYELTHALPLDFLNLLKEKFLCYKADIYTDTVPCYTFNEKKCEKRCRRNLIYSHEENCHLAYCSSFFAPDDKIQDEELHSFVTNMPNFLEKVAEILELRHLLEEVGNNSWLIGELSSSASKKHPVFFVADEFPEMLNRTISDLLLKYHKTPIVIFSVIDLEASSDLLSIIKDRKCLVIQIDECLNITNELAFKYSIPRNEIFKPLLTKNTATVQKNDFGFDFPKGTSWENLNIHILDNETVSFYINGSSSKHTKDNMNLTKALWELLLTFSLKNGRLPSEHILQNEYMKKRKLRLNNQLKKYFKTKEDAIVLTEDNKEYICRFTLHPDYKSSIYHQRKRK